MQAIVESEWVHMQPPPVGKYVLVCRRDDFTGLWEHDVVMDPSLDDWPYWQPLTTP